MKSRFLVVVWCLAAFFFSSCSLCSHDEVARVTSPSGEVDAVLIESNCGATTSFEYQVFLVPAGGSTQHKDEVASFYGATRGRAAYGVNLKWDEAATLSVEYLKARRETLIKPEFTVGDQLIHIRLRRGVEDPSAPPGGMLYNLRGRPYD